MCGNCDELAGSFDLSLGYAGFPADYLDGCSGKELKTGTAGRSVHADCCLGDWLWGNVDA